MTSVMCLYIIGCSAISYWFGHTVCKMNNPTRCTWCNKNGITRVDHMYCEDYYCTNCMRQLGK